MGATTRTHAINPDCAAKMERTATILDGVVKDVTHITEVIYGNGKPGIKELLEGTMRKIDELTMIVQEMVRAQKTDAAAKEKEKSEQRGDVRKFGLQTVMTLIVAATAVAQSVAIYLLVGK
jgi:hypothetical protein